MFLNNTQKIRISMAVCAVMGLYVLPWTKNWFKFLDTTVGGQVTIASILGIWLIYLAVLLYTWRKR